MRRLAGSCTPSNALRPALATALLALVAAPGLAAGPPTLAEALKRGRAVASLRYRYEEVRDDAAGDRHARASTLRTVLGYGTLSYRGWSLYAEAENVAVIGSELFANAGAGSRDNGVRDRPVVADVAGTEIQQAILRYQSDAWRLALGRQEILIGDQRFVGNVGWRQNHQSFDAVRADGSLGGLRLGYSFLDRVNRISGDSRKLAGHLVNVGFDLQNFGEFSLYGLLLDYREAAFAALSTSTWGLEFAGRRARGGRLALLYEIELAEQRDWADNPLEVDAGYSFVMLGAALPRLTVKLGWEVLEGSPTDGQLGTPLGTLHEFNGWADRFLTTPADGLEDLHLEIEGKAGRIDWLVRYHDFGAQSGAASYGDELDLRLLYRAPNDLRLGLKGALYDADRFAADTDKWMVWAEWGF